jgi:signal transduction histidine kinase
MLTEVQAQLGKIRDSAGSLLADSAALSHEQMRVITTIETNARGLLELLSDLENLIRTEGKKQAVRLMSHEWRTRLTSIKAFTQMLAEGHFGSFSYAQLLYLQTIHANVQSVWDWTHAD